MCTKLLPLNLTNDYVAKTDFIQFNIKCKQRAYNDFCKHKQTLENRDCLHYAVDVKNVVDTKCNEF